MEKDRGARVPVAAAVPAAPEKAGASRVQTGERAGELVNAEPRETAAVAKQATGRKRIINAF